MNHIFFRRVATILLAPTFVSSVLAADNSKKTAEAGFARLEARSNSRIGVSAIDLSTNRRVDYRSDERFIMCSTFKVLAAAAVLKRVDENKEKLDRFVRYGEAQLLSYAPVTREHVKEGGMTLEALCAAAVEQSDNTAANLLLEAIGGPEKWTEFARSLGDNLSRLDHTEPDLNIARPGKEDDTTTPAAMCANLQRLFTSDVLSVASGQNFRPGWSKAKLGLGRLISGEASRPIGGWATRDLAGAATARWYHDILVVRPPGGGPILSRHLHGGSGRNPGSARSET